MVLFGARLVLVVVNAVLLLKASDASIKVAKYLSSINSKLQYVW